MKILHLAAGNRWTGAAAPAFAEVEALRDAGIEAHYAYTGGYKLEKKLAGCEFAHPIIEKAQNPRAFARSVHAIENLIRLHGFNVLHAHLTYDHWLARFAARRGGTRMVRTFHSRRTLRGDPLTRMVLRRTAAVCIINASFAVAPLLRGRNPAFTPPQINNRFFKPQGPDVRERYSIGPDQKVVMAIGKLSAGRGFEDVLRTFAIVRRSRADARLMIVGHGEHRPLLETLAQSLGIAGSVVWAGYREDDLPEHYRAANLLLFTAAGSDEGHRAVLEAMACGVPPASYPIAGIDALLGPLALRMAAPAGSPEALAAVAMDIIEESARRLSSEVVKCSQDFSYVAAANRLSTVYSNLM